MAGERKIVKDNLKRVLLKEYIMKETARAGFGGLDIQRTPMGTRITLFAERPGIVIGRRGASIKALTANLDRGFDLDNPQIEVEEVGNPALNGQIMAEKLASALERGWHFRRAGHSTLRRIMASGAKGALIRISGKLTSQRHRTEKFKAGHIKYNGEPKNLFVDQGFSTAKLKRGTIGVTVWITDPNAKLPDEIDVLEAEPPAEAPGPEEGPPTEEPVEEPPEGPAEEAEGRAKAAELSVEGPTEPGPPKEGEGAAKAETPVAPGPVPPTPVTEATEVAKETTKAGPEGKAGKPSAKGKKARLSPPKKAPAAKPGKEEAPKKKAAATPKKRAAAKKKKEAK